MKMLFFGSLTEEDLKTVPVLSVWKCHLAEQRILFPRQEKHDSRFLILPRVFCDITPGVLRPLPRKKILATHL